MTAIDHETLVAMLDRLKLTAIRDQLDTLLDEAARSKMTLREALGFFIQREIARRDERRISMASKIAQFPFVRELSGFEFDAQPSLDPGQIRELATCRWIAWRHDPVARATWHRETAFGCEPGARGDPAEPFRAIRHRRHSRRRAREGAWRWVARPAADTAQPAEAADPRRAWPSAVRGQRRASVLPAGVAPLREGIDPDPLEPIGRRGGWRVRRSRRRHRDPRPTAPSFDRRHHSRRQLPASREAPLRPSAEGPSGARALETKAS